MVRGHTSSTRQPIESEFALVDGLAQLSFEVQGRLAEIAARHDLSLTQVRLLGVLRDLYVNRRIHKVYLYALPPLMVVQAFVTHTWMSTSAWWVRIGHAILG